MASTDSTQTPLWDTGEPKKRCRRCNQAKSINDFGIRISNSTGRRLVHSYCRACNLEMHSESYFRHRDKRREYGRQKYHEQIERERSVIGERRRINKQLQKYGIDSEQYDAMFKAQGGVCAICRQTCKKPRLDGTPTALAVDHCHKTGKVRGLLCSRCNVFMGRMEERVEWLLSMIDYLERHK